MSARTMGFRGAMTAGVLASFFVACAPQAGEFTIRGTVDPAAEAVLVSIAPPMISDGWSVPTDPEARSFDVGSDGSFTAVLDVPGPTFARVTVGDIVKELYAEPGWVLAFDAPSREGNFDVGGDDAGANAAFAEQLARLDSLNRALESAGDAFRQPAASFRAQIDALEDSVRRSLEPIGVPAIDDRVARDLEAVFGRMRLYYPTVHWRLTGASAEVPPDYHESVVGEALASPTGLSSSNWVAFLDSYVTLMSAGSARFGDMDLPREKLMARYETIASLEAHPEIKDYLYAELFRAFRISYGPRDWAPVFAAFEAAHSGHPLVSSVGQLLEEDLAVRDEPTEIRVFREVDGVELEAHVFEPAESGGSLRPAYLFFHGGGWTIGTPEWGYAGARRMAEQGFLAISFEYRLGDVHGSDLLAAVDDVQAAVAWVRERADDFGVDPDRVVAAGFSAGAHLAGTTAMLPDVLEASRPDALILHSSSYDLTKGRFFEAMTGGRAESVSLQHNVPSGLVPTLMLHARYDHLAPISEFEAFVAEMEAQGNEFTYEIFDLGHFFRNEAARTRVTEMTDEFLRTHGFMSP